MSGNLYILLWPSNQGYLRIKRCHPRTPEISDRVEIRIFALKFCLTTTLHLLIKNSKWWTMCPNLMKFHFQVEYILVFYSECIEKYSFDRVYKFGALSVNLNVNFVHRSCWKHLTTWELKIQDSCVEIKGYFNQFRLRPSRTLGSPVSKMIAKISNLHL